MRRVCKPGGVVAARDSDYAAFTWYPAEPDARRVARDVRHGRPRQPRRADAGRFLLAWAHAAGFTDVAARRVRVVLRDARGPRVVGRPLGRPHHRVGDRDQAVEIGAATAAELDAMAAAWRRWAADPDGWFAVLHGEILASLNPTNRRELGDSVAQSRRFGVARRASPGRRRSRGSGR